ncbi:ABC-F family ATP-binding cassette domain-containing protein [Nocardioides mesophilus]|uniref:ABC-F family ATP-binding cassette domain-containing protein n=1 Tax=Nocardioides mesophilus TaxID=433659 RepID=A0A7G9R8U7_9ACTN|nr:ABC-F family ATP-binding cassette domain-containing protein [Nocardioides mesophilus]QNN52022.1 ABC-F family ATP-binding cassette domain-containing protein [Nocardioides mesophilus]
MPARSLTRLSPLVGRDLAKAYGDRVVLDGVDVVASPGSPLGVVGENGVGKSTLMRLLAGVDAPDAGSVVRPAELAYLPQEPEFPAGAAAREVLDAALRPLHAGVRRLEELAGQLTGPEAAEEYVALLDWAVQHKAWDADRRAEMAAARLGLGAVHPGTPVAVLSGGQRSRLALAALVAARPGCVVLDEPTNHLDDAGVALLEEFLRDLPGVVVLASHDRALLEAVCTQVVDLDPSHFGTDGLGGNRFSGGYAAHLAGKREARRRWEAAFVEQQEELDRLRAATRGTARQVAHNRPPRDNDKFIYHSKGEKVARTVSRRVRDAERRIEELESRPVPKPPRELSFDRVLARTGGSGRVVQVRGLAVADRLAVPLLDVAAGEHLLVTGANGSGKSTLLKVLAGVLEPTSGTAVVSSRTTGYLPQDVTFARPERTPHQVYAALTGSPVPLGELGLLHPRELSRPVGVLSVGQQRRLALAVLVARQPDLLLLDEPTNHISLTLADELEESLGRSPGTVVVASHDRWLRGRWEGLSIGL